MAIERAFLHTATVKRPTRGAADVLNQPTAGVSQTIYTALPGRLVERRERIITSTWAASTVVTTYLWLTAANADLREADLLTSVTLEDGTTVSGSFVVTQVLRRVAGAEAHHKAAVLEVVD